MQGYHELATAGSAVRFKIGFYCLGYCIGQGRVSPPRQAGRAPTMRSPLFAS